MDAKEQEFFDKCIELLDYFHVDHTKDVMYLTSGGNSCIMNPTSIFYKTFGGHSINSVTRYVAEKLNKKIEWEHEA